MRRPGGRSDWRVVHQVAAWCLGYPDDDLLGRLPLLRQALDEQRPHRWAAAPVSLLSRFVAHLGSGEPEALRSAYVDTFDLSRRQTLYLSYWTDGDTRRRGETIAAIKQRYRASGWLVDTGGDLPDHLPMVLEYAALADPAGGADLLAEHRPSLELIRLSLAERGSAYADVLAAVCATLPGRSPQTLAEARSLWRSVASPPAESVGLGEPVLLGLPTIGAAAPGATR
ncbi:respiratory nitrate reductase chaperone NarJ [Nocardioides terrae]|uniref:Respiratory nitrate reductase chaperone NarJ n=1 Tax=Nocardioides terrae TaxID=574651 RepID=A0A1I1M960_9ACTN|nr:nitrate reductase molybdenum cofactor assembly chaperone [Nocardioides terrae]SFC79758.1 respiratory nitrate reductase chaperone NarJ [Nocardioides terrae]